MNSGRDKEGRWRQHKLCGVMMHASLAVTLEGLPLGLSAARFWSRAQFKGLLALKRKVNQNRVPIEIKESIRWLDNMRGSRHYSEGTPPASFTSAIARTTSMNSTARRRSSGPTLSSAPALIVWPVTASTPCRPRWPRSLSRDITSSR